MKIPMESIAWILKESLFFKDYIVFGTKHAQDLKESLMSKLYVKQLKIK